MKNFLRTKWKLLSLTILSCLFLSFIGIGLYIGEQVRDTIRSAQTTNPGEPISSLLAIATSTEHTISERNSAIWALGQLGSSQALAPLEKLHSGENCDHSSELCQYGLEKAIKLCQGELNIGALVWRHGEMASL